MELQDQTSEFSALKSILRQMNPKNGEPCAYCGMLSTDKEHVIPISHIQALREMKSMGLNVEVPREVIVQSCHECNVIAGNKIFQNFKAKKEFIRERLVKKYRKFINYKIWSDEEVMALDGGLRQYVFLYNEVSKILQKRAKRLSR